MTLLRDLAEWALPAVAVKAMVPYLLLCHRRYGLGRLGLCKVSRFELTLKWLLLRAQELRIFWEKANARSEAKWAGTNRLE